jgi:mannan endo-1,4-beta-mannosidase
MMSNGSTQGAQPRLRRPMRHAGLLAIVAAAVAGYPAAARADDHHGRGHGHEAFVEREGSELRLHDRPFAFGGANNYYLMYKSQFMVDDALTRASSEGVSVVRNWGAIDIGNQDDTNSVSGKADGVVYFHYWDGAKPAFNDGADGLEHLDYVIYRAGQLGLKLIIPLVNNWSDFGGMDQYVRWLGGASHDQFYSDHTIRGWYKEWIRHLLERTNSITGVPYKDDPTILAWELANEPRCAGSGDYPTSAGCTTQTLIDWADDVSDFVKRVDSRHLVEVGDEGFYCIPGSTDVTENCSQGVDTVAFARLRNIDSMSFHLYPDSWGKDAAWGTEWIERHFRDARRIGKPAVLGEFGLLDQSTRNPNYKTWTDAVLREGGTGAVYWMLAGEQDDGTLYPDFDGYAVYCPGPICQAFGNFAAMTRAERILPFPPVADVDTAVTVSPAPVTLNPPANDVAYDGAHIVPASLDLDPSTPGRQTTLAVSGGAFAAAKDGTVVFTPEANFGGTAQASYVISDSFGRTSNVATLTVTVKGASLLVESFETGADGWAFASWQTTPGTDQQTTAFHTDGNFGLEVDAVSGGWLGIQFPTALDFTGKNHIVADVEALGAGTSANIAFQFGSSFTWCQGNTWGWVNPNSTATVDIDMDDLDCGTATLDQIDTVYVFFSGPGTYYLDNVRAEQ